MAFSLSCVSPPTISYNCLNAYLYQTQLHWGSLRYRCASWRWGAGREGEGSRPLPNKDTCWKSQLRVWLGSQPSSPLPLENSFLVDPTCLFCLDDLSIQSQVFECLNNVESKQPHQSPSGSAYPLCRSAHPFTARAEFHQELSSTNKGYRGGWPGTSLQHFLPMTMKCLFALYICMLMGLLQPSPLQ